MNIGKFGGALDNSCCTVARPINKYFDKERENPEKIENLYLHYMLSRFFSSLPIFQSVRQKNNPRKSFVIVRISL